jgi:hypothetical protein
MKISPKYQKDYKKLEIKNPRLIKEKKRTRLLKVKIVCILCVLLMLFLVYFLFFSGRYSIKNVQIEGINKISREKFEKIVTEYQNSRKFLIFSRNNLLLFSEKSLREKIGESYLLETVKITKEYPGDLKIIVKEKDAKIVWLSNNKCYHLDDEAYAIEYCEVENSNLIKIQDISVKDLKIGEKSIDKYWLSYLIDCQELLKKHITPINFKIDSENLKTITVNTIEGFDIYLNTTLDLNEQVTRLATLIKNEEIKGSLSQIKYFDLRFGEKIYYK